MKKDDSKPAAPRDEVKLSGRKGHWRRSKTTGVMTWVRPHLRCTRPRKP